MDEQIKSLLSKITGAEASGIALDVPENLQFGDYSTNFALKNFDPSGKFGSPREFADSLIEKLKSDEEALKLFDKIENAGPGFINFFIKKTGAY